MSTFDKLASLPVEVDGYTLEGLRAQVSSGFERLSTVVHLTGSGAEGVGEDVVYDAEDQVALQEAGPVLDLSGRYSLGEFCERIDGLDLFPVEPQRGEVSRLYRRWTFHSAALDLALRQAGRPLHAALGLTPQPLTFVVSLRLGEPPAIERVLDLLDGYPGTRFKLDPTSDWDEALVARLNGLGAVATVDLKGAYRGTVVDQPADTALYRLVAEGFPEAWIEDPDLSSPDADAVLEPYRARITWDAIIHSVADVEALPFAPRGLNVKPSRFGSLRALLDTYDYCRERSIVVYGGGQFELGPGRGQIQYLASLFSADGPNDVAPGGFNDPVPAPGLPSSPLSPRLSETGFRWDADGLPARPRGHSV